MRPRTNSGHSLSRFSVPLLPKPQVEKRALDCLIPIAKQSFSVHCHLRQLRGTLKIVFQLELLSARASRTGQFAHFRVVTPSAFCLPFKLVFDTRTLQALAPSSAQHA